MLEVVEQFGLSGVDGVGDMSPTQYRWYLEALVDRQQRKEREMKRQQNAAR